MTARDLAQELRPRDRGVPDQPWRQARVVEVRAGERPPVLMVGGDGDLARPVRIVGDISTWHPGDVVAYLERGGGAIALGRVPILGIGDPDDPDDQEPLEAWHEIGAADQPPFQNGWVNYGDPYDTAGYYMQPDFWVRLKGVVRSGTDNTIMFTLPEAYWPPASFAFTTSSNGAVASVTVFANGTVRKTVGGNNTYVSLDGITYPSRWNPLAWRRPVEMNGWARSLSSISGDPGIYVRDDGWCWMNGIVSGGTIVALAMIAPEPARTLWGDIHAVQAFGVGRWDHGGVGGGRGTGQWIHRTGSNGEHYLSGKNWFAHTFPDDLTHPFIFQNGWTDYDSGFRPCSYVRDHYGIVHLMGLAQGAGKTSNFVTTLPAGYRPAKNHIYLALVHGDVAGRVNVYADGRIEVASAPAGYASLTGITFRAMQ